MTKSRDQEQHKHSIFCRFELTLDVYVENTFWYGPFGSFAKINHQVEPMRVKHSRDDALCRLIHVCMYILQLSMMIHIIATDTGTANTLVPCTQINRYSKFVCSARSLDNIPKFNTIYGFVCVWFVYDLCVCIYFLWIEFCCRLNVKLFKIRQCLLSAVWWALMISRLC